MFTDISKFTDKLVQLGLTAEQYFVLFLIDTRDVVNLKKYIEGNGKFDKNIFTDLLDKGYLLNTHPTSKSLDLGNLVVTLEFAEENVKEISEEEAYEQLLDAYPKFVEVGGTKYPSTGLNLSDSNLACKAYAKEIKNNKLLHAEILSLLRIWKQSVGEFAPFKIDKFITSKYWTELRTKNDTEIRPRIY